jgi:hypothetical protein
VKNIVIVTSAAWAAKAMALVAKARAMVEKYLCFMVIAPVVQVECENECQPNVKA